MTTGGSANYNIAFNATDNITAQLNKIVRSIQQQRKILTAGGAGLEQVVSIGEGAGKPFINATRHAQVYQTQIEQLVGQNREFNGQITQQAAALGKLRGVINQTVGAVQQEQAEREESYTEAILNSKYYQAELKKEFQLARERAGLWKLPEGQDQRRRVRLNAEQEAQIRIEARRRVESRMMGLDPKKELISKAAVGKVPARMGAALATGAMTPQELQAQTGMAVEPLGQAAPTEELMSFSKEVAKLQQQLLKLVTTGTATASNLKQVGMTLDGLTQTARRFQNIELDKDAEDFREELVVLQMDLDGLDNSLEKDAEGFRDLSSSLDQATFEVKELENAEKQLIVNHERMRNSAVEAGKRTFSQTQKKQLTDAQFAFNRLNREIKAVTNEAKRNTQVWNELGINAGLSTRRVADLEHRLRQLQKEKSKMIRLSKMEGSQLRLTAKDFEFSTNAINKQIKAQQVLGGEVARTTNRMGFMTDSSIGVQNGMRKISAGMQGAMTAMSLMNGDVMGLAFSLIFLQFSGALKASAAFFVLTIAIMGAMKVFKKFRDEHKELKDNEKVFATLTGSATSYQLALKNAEKMTQGLLLSNKDEEEVTKALVQTQLHLRKARLDATPERLKVASAAFLTAKGYGMEFDAAVQETLSTVMDFAVDSNVAFDGVAMSMEDLIEMGNNYLHWSRENPGLGMAKGVEFATLTVADLVTGYKMAGIEIPKALTKLADFDPSRLLAKKMDNALREEILAPWNRAFGEDGETIVTFSHWIRSFMNEVSAQSTADELTAAFEPFITIPKAIPSKWNLEENAKAEIEKLRESWKTGRVDTERELSVFAKEIATIMSEINAHMALTGIDLQPLKDDLAELAKLMEERAELIKPKQRESQTISIADFEKHKEYYVGTGLLPPLDLFERANDIDFLNPFKTYGFEGHEMNLSPNTTLPPTNVPVSQTANININIDYSGTSPDDPQALAQVLHDSLKSNQIFDVFPEGLI